MKTGLSTGLSLTDEKGNSYRVGAFLGSGTQGEVYEVHCQGGIYALKWYFPNQATEDQFKRLQRLVAIGPPNGQFLWPLGFVKDRRLKGFGYYMALRPKGFKSLVDLMKRRIDPSFAVLLTSAAHLVESFRKLHDKGLCYRDISFGNVAIHPESGDIRIGDNDNISTNQDLGIGVLGTPRFMAPEIVRGESKPTILSDQFSLSVLLFYVFFLHHPLEGQREASIKCFDLPAMKKLYGFDPIFIYDPYKSSNRPVRGVHDNAIAYWGVYPEFFKAAFVRSFTEGLKAAEKGRLNEEEWKILFSRMSNALHQCSCGAENFYDIQYVKAHRTLQPCWHCKKTLPLPPRMLIGEEVLVLHNAKKVYEHQLVRSKTQQFSRPIFEIVMVGGTLALKNCSTKAWPIVTDKGGKSLLQPGQHMHCGAIQELYFSDDLKAVFRCQ